MKKYLLILATLLLLIGAGTRTTQAAGITIIHEETVQVGPYQVVVGFSEWPPQAERSFDLIFTPKGGVEGKQGTVTLIGPDGSEDFNMLERHPRMHEVWGFNLIALPLSGPWTLQFEIDGAQGKGTGRLSPVDVGPRPGPPALWGWLLATIPTASLCLLLIINWRHIRPGKQTQTWVWEV